MIYFVFSSLGLSRGGLTKAVMARANMFVYMGYEVKIITYIYQPEFQDIVNELQYTGQLSEQVSVCNFFDEMLGFNRQGYLFKKINYFFLNASVSRVFYRKINDGKSYRLYRNGLYKKYVRHSAGGRIEFIDFMDHSRARKKRLEFDRNNRARKEISYCQSTNRPKLERYFNALGKCILTVWVNPDTNKKYRTILFSKKESQEYKSLRDCQREWVKSKLDSSDAVVFSDSRKVDDLVDNLGPSIKKVAVIHNNHFSNPEEGGGSKTKDGYNKLFSYKKFDRYVFLTNRQKNDVVSQYEISELSSVIPHYIENKDNLGNDGSKKIVMVARLEDQKRIDHAISAMKIVIEKHNNVILEIYGSGSLKGNLDGRIKNLGLTEHVFLKGYAKDVTNAYYSATCSLLTSKHEGFGLVVLESLAYGIPVVSYDCRYGPSDMIVDGVNGYLVEDGNINKIAGSLMKIIELDSSLYSEMSSNAIKTAKKFSMESSLKKWSALLEEYI